MLTLFKSLPTLITVMIKPKSFKTRKKASLNVCQENLNTKTNHCELENPFPIICTASFPVCLIKFSNSCSYPSSDTHFRRVFLFTPIPRYSNTSNCLFNKQENFLSICRVIIHHLSV